MSYSTAMSGYCLMSLINYCLLSLINYCLMSLILNGWNQLLDNKYFFLILLKIIFQGNIKHTQQTQKFTFSSSIETNFKKGNSI